MSSMLKPLGDGAPVAAARAAAPPTTAIAVFRVDVLFVMDGLMRWAALALLLVRCTLML